MKHSFLLIILILSFGCAHKSEIQKEMEREDISLQSVLDLSRSSYLKGCVEGMKSLIKKETKGATFNFCKVKAQLHASEIRTILK